MGILCAVVGALALAIGNELQHRGVVETKRVSQARPHLRRLASNPIWLAGAALIITAVSLQLLSLALANLVVVQPIGAIGLVASAILLGRRTRRRLPPEKKVGIALCLVGVALVVILGLSGARDEHVTPVAILIAGASLAVIVCLRAALARYLPTPLVFAVSGGFLFGFVATFAQLIVDDVTSGRLSIWSLVEASCLAAALWLGTVSVQRAHETGTSTFVLASLTVVDPLTGIVLTGTVFGALGNAAHVEIVGLVLSGCLALAGVVLLSRKENTRPPSRASLAARLFRLRERRA